MPKVSARSNFQGTASAETSSGARVDCGPRIQPRKSPGEPSALWPLLGLCCAGSCGFSCGFPSNCSTAHATPAQADYSMCANLGMVWNIPSTPKPGEPLPPQAWLHCPAFPGRRSAPSCDLRDPLQPLHSLPSPWRLAILCICSVSLLTSPVPTSPAQPHWWLLWSQFLSRPGGLSVPLHRSLSPWKISAFCFLLLATTVKPHGQGSSREKR